MAFTNLSEGLIKGCHLQSYYYWTKKLLNTEAAQEDPATLGSFAIWEFD